MFGTWAASICQILSLVVSLGGANTLPDYVQTASDGCTPIGACSFLTCGDCWMI
ncbi:hypothetical protein BGX38DRAFT_1153509, partial [Terfezia claveryi]